MSTSRKVAIRRVIGMLYAAARDYENMGEFEKAADCRAHAMTLLPMAQIYETPWGQMSRQELRTRLCEAQNHRCCYCGVEMTEPRQRPELPRDTDASIEHVHPVMYRGRHSWWNCVAACFKCNNHRPSNVPAVIYFERRLEIIGVRRKRHNKQNKRRGKPPLPLPTLQIGEAMLSLM